MSQGAAMIPPGGFLTNLAAALAYDLLRAGAARR